MTDNKHTSDFDLINLFMGLMNAFALVLLLFCKLKM